MKSLIYAILLASLTLSLTACGEDDPPANPDIKKEALPEGRVITPNNRCGQGFSWCEKQQKCLKPLTLLKGRDLHDLKKIFDEECNP